MLPTSQPASQPASKPTSQPTNQLVSQAANQPVRWSVSRATSQSASQSGSQPACSSTSTPHPLSETPSTASCSSSILLFLSPISDPSIPLLHTACPRPGRQADRSKVSWRVFERSWRLNSKFIKKSRKKKEVTNETPAGVAVTSWPILSLSSKDVALSLALPVFCPSSNPSMVLSILARGVCFQVVAVKGMREVGGEGVMGTGWYPSGRRFPPYPPSPKQTKP